jgi:hypothetical protein
MAFSVRRKNQSFFLCLIIKRGIRKRKVLECDNLFSEVKEKKKNFFFKSLLITYSLQLKYCVCLCIYTEREKEKEFV